MEAKPLPEITPQIIARFWSHVQVGAPTVCWPWLGCKGRGYGHFTIATKRVVRAHRVAYEIMIGPTPGEGFDQIDHLCRNRACCNPAHMEVVSAQVNNLRGNSMASRHSKKTHCPQGHPLEGTNLHLKPRKNGKFARVCLTCRRSQQRVLNTKYRDPSYHSVVT